MKGKERRKGNVCLNPHHCEVMQVSYFCQVSRCDKADRGHHANSMNLTIKASVDYHADSNSIMCKI